MCKTVACDVWQRADTKAEDSVVAAAAVKTVAAMGARCGKTRGGEGNRAEIAQR